jgi:hypothetical protein
VTAAANDRVLHDEYVYAYDASTGDVTLTIECYEDVGTVVFNAFQLAAAAGAGHSYK